MKKMIVWMSLFLVFLLAACEEEVDLPFIEEVDQIFELNYDGLDRRYYVYVPSEVKKDSPMLFMLHGYGSTIELFLGSTEVKKLADRDKVILVVPEGTPAVGLNHWDANLRYEEIDDLGFIETLRNSLIEEHHVNEELVFLGGHSNGGFMAYKIACEAPHLFRAYMSVSGTMSGETWETCQVDEEVNLFHFHGTSDLVVPMDGSMTELFGWGGAPEIEVVLSRFTDPLQGMTMSMEEVNERLSKTTYQSTNGTKVVYYKAENYGHMWANDGELLEEENDVSDMTDLLWDYMMTFVEE